MFTTITFVLLALFSRCKSQENIQINNFTNEIKQHSRFIESESEVEIFDSDWMNKSTPNDKNRVNKNYYLENIVVNDKGNFFPQESSSVKDLAAFLNTLYNKQVILLIQDSENNIRYSLDFKQKLIKLGVQCQFLLMKFNATGASRFLNESDLKVNDNISTEQANYLGFHKEGVAIFYGILKAALSLPSDTVVILFANEKAIDEDLGQLALTSLKSKRIKLYVIWTGKLNNEEGLLQETAILSEGKFIVDYVKETIIEREESRDTNQDKALVFVKYNVIGYKKFNFNIERKTNALHIILSGYLESAFLFTPNGLKIDLFNAEEVLNYSPGSYINSKGWKQPLQIQINLGKSGSFYVGKWNLETKATADNTEGYNITVFVRSDLGGSAYLLNQEDATESAIHKRKLHILVTGNISKIENVAILDITGDKINENITFNENINNAEKNFSTLNIQEDNKITRDVEVYADNLPHTPFYVQFSGQENVGGSNFTRLSYVNPIYGATKKNPLTVEISQNSNLIVNPGQSSNIYFEVTNNRDQPIYLYFQCNDEKSFLRQMTPLSAYVPPAQTTVVTVTTYVRPNVPQSTTNTITFTVLGQDYEKKSAVMVVGDTRPKDDSNPRVWHRYTSDCTDILLSSCERGTWTIEVTAQDLESGLLSLTTSPIGLNIPNGFISGTKEEVVGYYSGACCSPDLQLTAVDMYKNYRTYTANAYRANLSAGAITAIVLGILILIIIIAIIIFFIVRRRRQKESLDLPTYRSPRSQTRI